MDTKDVMRNFLRKATSMKVPLLKSAIHHDAASSKSSHSDGSFNNWRVPSSNFGNEVSVHDWVKFWFRGPNRYAEPSQKVSKDDARCLHHLAMLQGRDLHLIDNGKLYIISLHSGYVTLRHGSNFIVESYSPIRFSRQFGFCQDVPGDLMERPYDVMIPTCLLEGAPLMTREYVDWWPPQRMNTFQGNLCIILKKTKQDSISISSKGASDQSKEKSHPSSKSQSKTSKDRDVPAKSKLRRLILASKTTSPAPEVGHGSFGTNELHVSLDNGNDQTSNLETPCDEVSHMYASSDGVGRPNASPSPTDHHWNRPKRKAQELDDVCCGIDILDTIVIDDNDFVDEDSNSASLFELAKQLDLQELYGGDLNNGAIADFTVDLNGLDAAAKDFHSSINDVMPSLGVVPPRKSPSNDVMPSLEVVPLRKSPSRPLRPDGFTELESSIASTLEEMRRVKIIDVSSLEDLVENFFKSYAEYDTLRSSKMTKESHEKALSDVQRRLDGAKLAHEKLDGSMEKLQATLADVERDLKALTSKKKKVTALINKYQ
ncbi:hypothetical protein R3W88_001177 [Solanum pinnatisectum]|uniref:Uncharacterized protein n=1 Tax=Solanum pinnatisectum TaxID=50273 RepID=A0AAV9MKS6_9SOLN|nr:hypothetical protein R3W88_001177 [Solanum pinnatisectum]